MSQLISFFIPTLQIGGAERVVVNLANGFCTKGYNVHVVLLKQEGQFINALDDKCEIINLGVKRTRNAFPSIYRYIKTERPDVVISSIDHLNVAVLLVKQFLHTKTKYIIIEHNVVTNDLLSMFYHNGTLSGIVPSLMKILYPKADRVIAVSESVKKSLIDKIPQLSNNVSVIYNPIFSQDILTKSKENVDDAVIKQWLNEFVIISVGRLERVKDYPTLIRAFAIVRQQGVDAKLVLLGDGTERNNLENLVKQLHLTEHVYMPGFTDNPYKYISKANVFVLSSVSEGLSSVLIEALGCGVPIVSTDCNGAPNEILDNGKYGKLVPINNPQAMAEAILSIFDNNNYDTNIGIQRAKQFSIEQAVTKYEEVIHDVCRSENICSY